MWDSICKIVFAVGRGHVTVGMRMRYFGDFFLRTYPSTPTGRPRLSALKHTGLAKRAWRAAHAACVSAPQGTWVRGAPHSTQAGVSCVQYPALNTALVPFTVTVLYLARSRRHGHPWPACRVALHAFLHLWSPHPVQNEKLMSSPLGRLGIPQTPSHICGPD